MKGKTLDDAVNIPVITSDSLVLARPKCRQNSKKTKVDLNKNIDPKTIKVSNVWGRNKGVAVIDCGEEE